MSVRIAVVSLAVLAVAAGGCGGDDGDGGSASAAKSKNPPFKVRVEITKDGYRPAKARVLLGGSVTFVNVDKERSHTAETGDITDTTVTDNNEFDTHVLVWEEPYTITFHKPGVVEYHSSLDPEMTGTVEVLAKR